MTSEDFPQIFQFLGAYFHEDWMCEFDLADDVVKSFIDDSESCVILEVIKEVDTILALNLTEDELRGFLLREIGCSYCYWHEWQDESTWLKHISVVLRDFSNTNI